MYMSVTNLMPSDNQHSVYRLRMDKYEETERDGTRIYHLRQSILS